jgi:hypothetical protein
LIAFYYGNAYCQPSKQAPSALETLGAIAKDSKGFNNGVLMPGFSGQASLENAFIPVPTPNIMQPDSTVDKGVTNNLTILFLKKLGDPPSNGEAIKIEQALNILNDSKIGKEICKSIGKTGCTWEDFKSAKIEITTQDLKSLLPEPFESTLSRVFGSSDFTAAVPKPSWVKGRTILCLDQELLSTNSPAYVAHYISHELSHIADNRTLGETTLAPITTYATEYKAVIAQMMLCDELLRTGKLKVNTADGVQFILSVYRWRNGGPKPNMDYSINLNGKRYSAAELIGTYAPPGDTGLKIIWKLIKFYNPKMSEGTINEKGLKYLRGIRGFIKELEPKYQSWFPSNPPPVVIPPDNPNNGNNGGGGNGGGGGGHDDGDEDEDDDDNGSGGGGTINPGNSCPNPHFDPVTGQALCF